MHFGDHPPPHFHVKYSGIESRVNLDDLDEVDNVLPRPVLRRVRQWASQHRSELWTAWDRATKDMPVGKIEPLR